MGFYHNYRGKITISDIDLNQYDIESLRSRTNIVSQNVFLFKGSVKDNIKMAASNAIEHIIDEATYLSGCTTLFQDDLNKVQIEEFGRNLSGGQIQAVAIARCMLKNPDFLMFDEATTHLDKEVCQIVMHAIKNVFTDKTRIIITHDREIAKMADRTFMLEDEKIRELKSKT